MKAGGTIGRFWPQLNDDPQKALINKLEGWIHLDVLWAFVWE